MRACVRACPGLHVVVRRYNNMIPISMYVMIEIANFVHAAFINEDAHMYSAKVDGKAVCRSANLCQELGQLE